MPMPSAAAQRMSSLKTQGVAARKSRVEPPSTVASQAPLRRASTRPTGAAGRTRRRTRHSSRPLMIPASAQAAAIIGAVVAAGSRWGATATIGRRSSEGKRPK